MNETTKVNLSDSLNLLWELINALEKDNIEYAKNRIKEYGYIADAKFIQKLINSIN